MNELEIVESVKGEMEEYPTTNLHIATVLRTVGHKFLEIRHKVEHGEETDRVEFVFADNDVKDDLLKWMNNEHRVCPRTLLENEAHLKNLVHSKKWKGSGLPQAQSKGGTPTKKKRRRRRRKKKGNGEQPAEQSAAVDGTEASEPVGPDTKPE